MNTAQTIAQTYIEVWNERDATRRSELLAASWTVNARYTDPMATARGAAEISALIGGVQQRFPTFKFTLISKVDGYGEHLRFSWGLGTDGADAPIKGTDFIALSDGKGSRFASDASRSPAR